MAVTAKVTVTAGTLARTLSNALVFACTDVTLPTLVGANLEFTADSEVKVVSTDRYA